jgi:hypothetical protein
MYFFSDFGESKIVSSSKNYEEFYNIRNITGLTPFYAGINFF